MNTLDLCTAHVMTCAVSLFALLLLEKKMQREDNKQAPPLSVVDVCLSFAALTLHRRLRRDKSRRRRHRRYC